MKRILFALIVCTLTIGTNTLFSQNLQRFVTKKAGTATEAAGERLDQESDTAVMKGVNLGIDKLKGRFFGTSGSSSEASSGTSTGSVPSPSETSESESSYSSGSSGSSGSSRSSSSSSLFGNALMGAMGMSGNVNAKELYDFDSYMKMEISNYDSKGNLEQEGKYDTYNSRESMSYAMVFYDDTQMSTIIFDTDNNLMLTLSESGGEKTGFAIAFDSDSIKEEMQASAEEYQEEMEDHPYNQYRTGKTKNIMGYKCEEYLVEDDQSETHIWVTDELNKQLQKDVMKNSLFAGMFLYAGYWNGVVLEYDFRSKESNERMVMQVTDLNMDKKHSISTRGYQIFSMSSPPAE